MCAAYNPKDYYFWKAKKENFAARSVFKLEEIDTRYKIFKPGQVVIDLGAAPGSWSQYASKKIGRNGKILGIDLDKISLTIQNAIFLQADFLTLDIKQTLKDQGLESVDIVLSDMAPKTSGIRDHDQMRSLELCEKALEFALEVLKPGGHFVCKLFHSGEFESFRKKLKHSFERVEALRPQSTRKESKEIFLIGLKKKRLTP